jgi:hypothetical protein
MSKLRAVLDRLNDIEATIARTTSVEPSNAVLLSLTSLEARRDDLLDELSEITKAEHVEICDYRIIPEQSSSYAIAGVTAALHQFQEIVTSVFDAMTSKPKQRAKISPEIIQKTQFDFGFAYSGSVGVVLTVPNDRLLMDEASTLDNAVAAVFDLLKIETPESVREAATKFGTSTVRKLHDWTKTHSQYGMAADIKWVRDSEVKKEVVAQPIEMDRIYRIIEQKQDKTAEPITLTGNLLGWNTKTKTFTLETADGQAISGHWARDFLSPAISRKVPARYRANLTKETTLHYAEDKEEVHWYINRLIELREDRPK